jgi:uncharacterized protein YkwD
VAARLKGIISAVLLVVIGLVFYYRASIFSYLSPKLASLEKAAINTAVEEIKRQVNAPPPLVAPKKLFPPPAAPAQLTATGTVKWTNTERKNNKLPSLAENSQLDKIADLRLADMFKNQYFAHVSPGSSSAETVAEDIGYDYLALGENLALGDFVSDRDLVEAWMASPGHRANILNTKYQEIGVAVQKGIFKGESEWIGVQIFGKPASSCPTVNDSLKAKIDSEQGQLQDMQSNLHVLKAEIESVTPRTVEGYNLYNKEVDQYNALVSEYNAFLAQVKSDTSEYNGEVTAFNQCLAE